MTNLSSGPVRCAGRYRRLCSKLGDERRGRAVFVSEAKRAAPDWWHQLARLRRREPWRRVRWQPRLLCRLFHTSPAWELRQMPVPGGFGLDITRRAIAGRNCGLGLREQCDQNGCAQDVRVAQRHGTPAGILFTRAETLAGGARCCGGFGYCPPDPAGSP